MTDPDIHREVLDNLEDGVLVVGMGGKVRTLNPAAERILGLNADEVAGKGFAELFVTREGFDDFTQMVIDATAEQSIGRRRVIQVDGGNETRALSIVTSYLRRKRASEPMAVIAVFSDITELRDLRETELRLAREAETQHRSLQDAYLEIEDRNAALAQALRKVRLVQGLGAVLAVALFLGAGFWTSRSLDLFEGEGIEASAASDGAERRLTVKPRPVSDSITLRGTLKPWRIIPVRSPVDGTVESAYYRIGQKVVEGETLLKLDISRARLDHSSASRRHAEALKRLRDLEDWENSPTMTKARRNFIRARLDLESLRTKINRSRFLFEEGLIPVSEHEDAEREFKGQELDFAAAEEELEATRLEGNEERLNDARLGLEAARMELRATEAALKYDEVHAPVSGVVLAPQRAGQEMVPGRSLKAGGQVLEIGDFSRMAVTTQVDEADVAKLRVGQKVTVRGNAFHGLALKGKVTHVSSQADPKSRSIPKFDARVTLDAVDPDEAAQLRTGMSARLTIVTYENPTAMLVPIDAVRSRGGEHRLLVIDPETGEAEVREVEIGPTTRTSVEIRAGLRAGETILLPGR